MVVAWTSVALVLLSLTGLWLWCPGKILRIQRGVSSRRVVFELHNAIGVLTWILMLLFGLTGMVVHWDKQATELLTAITDGPVALPPPKPDSACAGLPIASLDLLRANLNAAAPGAYATSIQAGPKSTDPVLARRKYPEDKTPAGRTLVLAQRCSGKVTWVLDARRAPFAYRAVRVWNRSIHTDDVYGWPTRILAVLMALLLPIMTLTGPLIWWMRRSKRAQADAVSGR